MASVAVTPLFMKDVLFQVGTDSYEKALSQVEFVPASSVETFTALSPGAVYTDASPATWTCVLTFVQDWGTADSLCNYLFDNEGSTVSATFEPIAGGPTITADIVIVPGSIGGTIGGATTSSVTLGVVGKPVIGA